jgi:iron-sulfur cluster assembly protein
LNIHTPQASGAAPDRAPNAKPQKESDMLSLTDTAVTAIRSAIDNAGQPVAGLRVMVQSGGCAGLKYGLALELAKAADDTVIETDGVTVLVDPESQTLLDGVVIDFVNGLEGSGFVFNNPNATGGCACGKSFSC